jgi:hypothetical protein
MTAIVVSLVFATLSMADETSRKPSPLAPSLRSLTPEEEKEFDGVIDRFIQFDTGRLKGQKGKQAVSDFKQLGPDAIPALIRGLNRAASIDYSCPSVSIAGKLAAMLRTSDDPDLLEFARENIGAGVTKSRHMKVLQELRVVCMLRKNALARMPATVKTVREAPSVELRSLSTSQVLLEALDVNRGLRRDNAARELDSRRAEEVIPDLGSAASDSDDKVRQRARELLDRTLSRLPAKELQTRLKDEQTEVRSSAARVAARKELHFERELIDLLEDDNPEMRQTARRALTRLNPRTDFGPDGKANAEERAAAVRKWRDWLARQNGQ